MFNPISKTNEICAQATNHVKNEWDKLPEDVKTSIKVVGIMYALTSVSGFAYHFGTGLADTITYKMRHND